MLATFLVFLPALILIWLIYSLSLKTGPDKVSNKPSETNKNSHQEF